VDGRIVPLNSELKSGQTIEIITSETHKPSYAWLKFVKTAKAIGSIKRYIRKTQFEESVRLGKDILEKESRKHRSLGLMKKVQESLDVLGFEDSDHLYAAVGNGNLTVQGIISKLFPKDAVESRPRDVDTMFIERARKSVKGVKIQGLSDLMVTFAKCCNPIPGDDIIGFVSRGRGVIVHKSDCSNLPALLEEHERLIDVEWDKNQLQSFLAQVKILGQERKNFLKDITDVIAGTNTNIISIDGNVDETIIHITLILQVGNLNHLNKVMHRIHNVQGIISVERK